MKFFLMNLYKFTVNQALCCIFPAAIFIILAVSKWITPSFLHRYDMIFILCVLVQVILVYSKIETIDELKVISLFHLIGLVLEIYKVHMGSWSYPEDGILKIMDVPIYSGFMYSSVASYICQAWKRMSLKFVNWPDKLTTYIMAVVIYANFFTHHYIFDIRWIIIASLFIIFRKAYVEFHLGENKFEMSLILSFFLIGIFIWIAENISTFFGAWKYPEQMHKWQIVNTGKITSWFLLVIISTIIVANLKHFKYKTQEI